MDSYPLGISAIGIIRFRLTICRGIADVLVKNMFFNLIILGCVILSVSITLLKLMCYIIPPEVTSQNITWNIEETRAHCHHVTNTEVDYLHIGIAVVMYVIPAILVAILYLGILNISSVSIGRVQQFRTDEYQRQRVSGFSRHSMTPSATPQRQIFRNVTEHQTRADRLWTSIITHVGCFLGVTIPVFSIEIYLSISEPNMTLTITLLYLKTIMCIFHALGEGIFTTDKRRKTRLFLDKFVRASRQSTTITRQSAYNNNIIAPAPLNIVVGNLPTLKEVSTLRKLSETSIKIFKPTTSAVADKNVECSCSGLDDITKSIKAPLPSRVGRKSTISCGNQLMTRKISSCSSEFTASQFMEECARDQKPEPKFGFINGKTNGTPQGKEVAKSGYNMDGIDNILHEPETTSYTSIIDQLEDFRCVTPSSDVFSLPDPSYSNGLSRYRQCFVNIPQEISGITTDVGVTYTPENDNGIRRLCESVRTLSVLSENM